MTASQIRAEARQKLTGKWGKGALIVLVFLVITYVISFVLNLIPLVGVLVSLVVSVPLSYGLVISMMHLNDDTEVGYVDFASNGFSNFGKAWSVTLWTFVKLILPSILLVISIIIMAVLMAYATTSGNSIMSVLGIIIYIAALVYVIIKQFSYRLAFFILTDNPEMTGKEAVEKSAELMNGHVGELFCLNLSFIGWAILCVFTLGIGMLWLNPYMQISEINFYRNLINK